jgi:hypothetical protein
MDDTLAGIGGFAEGLAGGFEQGLTIRSARERREADAAERRRKRELAAAESMRRAVESGNRTDWAIARPQVEALMNEKEGATLLPILDAMVNEKDEARRQYNSNLVKTGIEMGLPVGSAIQIAQDSPEILEKLYVDFHTNQKQSGDQANNARQLDFMNANGVPEETLIDTAIDKMGKNIDPETGRVIDPELHQFLAGRIGQYQERLLKRQRREAQAEQVEVQNTAEQRRLEQAERRIKIAREAEDRQQVAADRDEVEHELKVRTDNFAFAKGLTDVERNITQDFVKLKIVVDFNIASRNLLNMYDNITLDTGASDIAFLFSYMKILDPTSVVTPGEQATAANAGGIEASVRDMYNRVLQGSPIPEQVRQDFLVAGRNIMDRRVKQFEALREFQGRRPVIERLGINPDRLLPGSVELTGATSEELIGVEPIINILDKIGHESERGLAMFNSLPFDVRKSIVEVLEKRVQ